MKRTKVLITGGVGFVGTNLISYLQKKGGYDITCFDKLPAQVPSETYLHSYTGDITSKKDVENVFATYGPFDTVYHLAAIMPIKEAKPDILWKTNVDGTIILAEAAIRHHTRSFVFTSSNVTYGIPKELPTFEATSLIPLEIYGKSKAKAEEELEKYKKQLDIQIIRCPVITGVGRLGLQAILFAFISENKKVYVLGKGDNKYQFVDVKDLCVALEKASHQKGFAIYNIGADEVLTLREIYQKVIAFAKSKSRIVSLPKTPALFLLALLDKVNLSPLGVYQYTMIGRSLYTNTDKIKRELKWQPKKTNLDTFIENYIWYTKHKGSFTVEGSGSFSSNRSVPKMRAFSLLKLLS